MRITCPNCAAQYEVDDALIPEGGRDVQCSNCGKGWFQPGREEPAADRAQTDKASDADEPEVALRDAAEDAPEAPVEAAEPEDDIGRTEPSSDEPVPHHDAVHADGEPAAQEPAAQEPAEPFEDDDIDDAPPPPPPPPPPGAAPRGTDESILSVLREEAEREIAQRRQDATPLESQPDLGLPETSSRSAADAQPETAEVGMAGRRDLLPDIDAINSSLRSDADRPAVQDDDDAVVEDRRRGFRLGFGIMLLIAGALIALYLGAEPLARAVPALEPVLVAYVDLANSLRTWIDGLLAAGVEGLSTLVPTVTGA